MKQILAGLLVSSMLSTPTVALPYMDHGIKADFMQMTTKTQYTHFDDENPNIKWVVFDRITLAEDPEFGPEFGLAYNSSGRPGTLTMRVKAGLSDDMLDHARDLQDEGYDVRIVQPVAGLWSLVFSDPNGIEQPISVNGSMDGAGEVVFGSTVTPQIPAVLRLEISPAGMARIVDSLRTGMAIQLKYNYKFRALIDELKVRAEIDWEKVSRSLQETSLNTKSECFGGGLQANIYWVSVGARAAYCAIDSKYINRLTKQLIDDGTIKISITQGDSELAQRYEQMISQKLATIVREAAFDGIDMNLIQDFTAPQPAVPGSCFSTLDNFSGRSPADVARSAVDAIGRRAAASPGDQSDSDDDEASDDSNDSNNSDDTETPTDTGPGVVRPGPGNPGGDSSGSEEGTDEDEDDEQTDDGDENPEVPARPGAGPGGGADRPAPPPRPGTSGPSRDGVIAEGEFENSAPTNLVNVSFDYCQQRSNYYVLDSREMIARRTVSYEFELKGIQEFPGEITGSLNGLCEMPELEKRFVNTDEASDSYYSFGCPVRAFQEGDRFTFWNQRIEQYYQSQGEVQQTTSLPPYRPSATRAIGIYGGWNSNTNNL